MQGERFDQITRTISTILTPREGPNSPLRMLKALAMLIVAFLKRASLLDDDGFVWQAGTPAEPDHRPLRAEFELGALAPAPTRAELLERVKAPYLAPLFEKQDA